MTQHRRGSAHDEDLDVGKFGLGLDDAPDPSDAFAVPPASQPARAQPPAMPEPDDFHGADDPFGGPPPSFERAASPAQPVARHRADPGDWASMQEIGGSASRPVRFGGGSEPDGDPAEEFAGFGGAKSVAALGRHAEAPEPKGSYRADERGHEDVVGSFGEDDDQTEIAKGSLYREEPEFDDPDEEEPESDQLLSMEGADRKDDEDDENADEADVKPSLVDRLKRFAIPAAAVAAIGGAGYVGWGYASPMLFPGDAAPIQTAAPIVPKQPAGGLPAFPPAAQAQQPPALPALPALPSQQAAAFAQQPVPARQAGLPQSSTLPQAPAPLLPAQVSPQAYQAGQPLQSLQQAAMQPIIPTSGPLAPPQPAAMSSNPLLGGGLNNRTAPSSDIEAKLAAIASDIAALRNRQEDASRSSQSDRDELRNRMGEVERRLAEARRPLASQTDREDVKPRRVERTERTDRVAPVERSARHARRTEPRALYREASADDGTPPLKPKVVQGFALKGVSRGIASVEGRGGVVEVGVGQNIPGVGEVKAIRRYGSDWVVVVGKGVIVQQ